MIPHDNHPLRLVRKLYQESTWEDVAKVSRSVALSRPLVVELDPTSFCDLACRECVSRPLLNQGRFTSERLLGLAREMIDAGVKAVILIGGGEPLLHAATGKVIRLLGEAGLSIGVTTNGTEIHRHLEVLADYATWTRVSVDAGSAGSYAIFRPSRSARNLFSLVIENMRLLARRRNGILGFSYLLLVRRDLSGAVEHNFDEVFVAGELAMRIGCDYFEVKPSYNLGHYLIRQPNALTKRLLGQLESLSRLANVNFRIITPSNLDVVLRHETTIEPKEYQKCSVSELRTLITSSGAYVCPYHRGKERWRYGDPTTTTFEELWNGELRADLMKKLDPSKHCRFHCIRHQSNQELVRIGRGKSHEEVIPDFDRFI